MPNPQGIGASRAGERRRKRQRADPRSRSGGPVVSVLAVDDEPTNRELVQALLEERGWRVLTAADGGEALAIVRTEHPDLIITDILMPTMDGFEFVRRLRESADGTPVLFYTATYHEDAARSLAAPAGVNAIVYKDGSVTDLLAAVEAALGSGSPVAALAGERPAFDEQHMEFLKDTLRDRTHRLQISNLRQAALIRFCAAIASERDKARMLSVACRSARDLAGAPFALLATFDEGGDPDHWAIAGREDDGFDAIMSTSEFRDLLRRPHDSGEVVLVDAWAPDSGPAADAALKLADMVGVPVRTDSRSYGSLWVSGTLTGGPVGAEETNLLAALARHVAISLENVRLIEEVSAGVGLLQAVVNGSEEAVFVKDRDGRYLLVNDKAASIIGRSTQDIIGRDDRDLLPPHDVDAIVAADREVMASGAPRVLEEVVGTTGGRRTYLSTKTPLIGSDGSVQGLVGYAVDITERKRYEERLREVQKLEALGRLASGTAHDFNNILTAISGFTELVLASRGRVDDHIEDLEAVREAAERGSALTRQLLIFGRQQRPRIQIVDVNDAVRAVLRLVRPLIDDTITVETRLGDDPLYVRMDPVEMEQVVLNLILNARDAGREGGMVGIATGRDPDGSVLLTVRDDGEGMSDETLARIFEPFFTTKPVGQGTGLGLAVVHDIVTRAGGTVAVESRLGTGSIFTVSLPIASADSDAPVVPESAADVSGPVAGGRVLVVEDDPLVRDFIAGCLRRDGLDVVVASSVAEGHAALVDGPAAYDALLCDMILGDGRGPTVAEAARAVKPDLPIIFMSGYVEREVMSSPIVAGSAFLAKPFGAEQLRQAVRQAVEGRPVG